MMKKSLCDLIPGIGMINTYIKHNKDSEKIGCEFNDNLITFKDLQLEHFKNANYQFLIGVYNLILGVSVIGAINYLNK